MKRILLVTFFTLIASLICFWIVKFWGQGQVFIEYKHPLFTDQKTPVEFIKPKPENVKAVLLSDQNIYLDFANTQDQELVAPIREWLPKEKPIQYQNYADIKNDVILLKDYKDHLKNKKIIFNMIENAQAGHEIFYYGLEQLGLERGENFIIVSPYEATMKALKENHPALIFGSTKPEILKILAMNSMYLVEAATIRADVIIHPLTIRGQTFYTDELLKDFARRHKKIIVGPITADQKEKAVSLNPYGLVILN